MESNLKGPVNVWMGRALPCMGGKYQIVILTFCRWFSGQAPLNALTCLYSIAIVTLSFMRHLGLVSARTLDRIQFMLLALAWPQLLAFAAGPDHEFNQRALGVYAFYYRFLLPFFFECKPMAVGTSIVLLINECLCTKITYENAGSHMPPRVGYVLLSLTVCGLIWFRDINIEWKTLGQAQQALAEEKVAQEVLISMLCDFCLHIGADGNSVTRGAHHLDRMLGLPCESKETKLTDYLPNVRGERTRILEAFERAKSSPVNLPVTLLSRWAENRLDMFIVRRDVGFLVGFRFARDGIDTIDTVMTFSPLPLKRAETYTEDLAAARVKAEAVASEWATSEISCGGRPQFTSEVNDNKLDGNTKSGTALPLLEQAIAMRSECHAKTHSLQYDGHPVDAELVSNDGLCWNAKTGTAFPLHEPAKVEAVPSEWDMKTLSSEYSGYLENVAVMRNSRCYGNAASRSALPLMTDECALGELVLREKYTFLCYEDDWLAEDRLSIKSAPPRMQPNSTICFASGSFAPAREKVGSDSGDSGVSGPLACSVVETLMSSSSSSCLSRESGVNVRIVDSLDHTLRLSTLLSLRNSAKSVGSAHAPNECKPCDFFNSPKGCRASTMCLYCHEPGHFSELPRRLRKLRPNHRPPQPLRLASN